ncbi:MULTISPECIES: hypothetical protein [unclassified Duganella]|uniref:hypothetical protein n=1 Tax=unclassified Duganella TaxID=2636909 RepID=UPI0006FF0F35|nr:MULTISPECIES: hypothetical protein [unclassified Duganella]KQV44717.1 hypothetical protein ASD07_19365 [Duganella sp. Root336D2]KRB83239.1 hypothetical protein ASE26_12205 [Duganella sp. Root198D2]
MIRELFAGLACLMLLGGRCTAYAQPLAAREVAEIKREAWRKKREEDAPGGAWQSLDRDKLVRLMRMPEFVGMEHEPKALLVDLAGEWDLMRFDKPSDVQARWAAWYPDRGFDKVVGDQRANLNRAGSFHSEPQYSPESGAAIALQHCLATPAWHVRHKDPMLWAVEQGAGWEEPNVFDFGQCVLQQVDDVSVSYPGRPATARGKQSAAILEQKLSAFLMSGQCTVGGPDACLSLLHALHSLNRQAPQLPGILQRLAGPGERFALPAALAERPGNATPDELSQLRALRERAMLRAIYLSVKLPNTVQQPDAWPDGELERELAILVELTVFQRQGAWVNARQDGLELDRLQERNPWARIAPGGVLPERLAQALEALGAQAAAAPGCRLAELQVSELPWQYWLGFALARLQMGQDECRILASSVPVARRYQEAAEGNPAALREIARLRPFLQRQGAGRDAVLAALVQACAQPHVARQDPWRICRATALYNRRIEQGNQ